MKTLPTEFTEKGFTHRQIYRDGDLAIYERTKGSARHFEVVCIGSHNGYEIAGAKIPPSETYPPSTQWGSKGWTKPTLESAEQKLSELKGGRK